MKWKFKELFMNNKGQALVFMIILLPIILLILIGTMEIGSLTYQKKRVNSNMKTIIKTCYDCSEEKIKDLFEENKISYEDLEITKDNNLEIKIKVKIKSIIKEYEILLKYTAITKDNNILVKRVS